jgi:hypothetical protein
MGRPRKSITDKRAKHVGSRVNLILFNRLATFGRKNDLTMAELIRAALVEYVNNHNLGKAA